MNDRSHRQPIFRFSCKPCLKFLAVALCCGLLAGCVYLRLLALKNQLAEFDRYYTVTATDSWLLSFREPLLYSDDLIELSGVQPTLVENIGDGQRWTYRAYKVDAENRIVQPPVSFYFQFGFNRDKLWDSWLFSPLFLQMLPPEFLEASLRSLGTAQIFQLKRQVRADLATLAKRHIALPRRPAILAALGEPIDIQDNGQVYVYRFQVETPHAEEEDNRLSEIKLYFDPRSDELIRLKGRFLGLKISIPYRAYTESNESSAD